MFGKASLSGNLLAPFGVFPPEGFYLVDKTLFTYLLKDTASQEEKQVIAFGREPEVFPASIKDGSFELRSAKGQQGSQDPPFLVATMFSCCLAYSTSCYR